MRSGRLLFTPAPELDPVRHTGWSVIATGVARLGTTQHVVYGAGHGNANGVQDRILDCTNTIVVTDPDVGPITITLVAQFILAPPN